MPIIRNSTVAVDHLCWGLNDLKPYDFALPLAGVVYQAGQKFNISYLLEANATEDTGHFVAAMQLEPYHKEDQDQWGSVDVEVPDVPMGAMSVDEDGHFIASWTYQKDCKTTAFVFTWSAPKDLTAKFAGAVVVDYVLSIRSERYNHPMSMPFGILPPDNPTEFGTAGINTPTPTSKSGGSKGLSAAAKTGIILAAIICGAACSLASWLVWRRRKQRRSNQPSRDEWAKPEIGKEEGTPGTPSFPPAAAGGKSVVREAANRIEVGESAGRMEVGEAASRIEVDSKPVVQEADGKIVILEADGRPERSEMEDASHGSGHGASSIAGS